MNRHLQFALAITSICLVFLLGLSAVNQSIHDGLFHSNFATENNTIPIGCSGNHDGACKSNQTNGQSKNCDASCPVNVFSNGVLDFDYIAEITTKTFIQIEVVSRYLALAYISEKENANLVRGPPIEKKA